MTRGTPKIGLALGSGAARGWSHIGIIQRLAEAGIRPDIVCGTSMGALVGGAYACGRLEALSDWALAADWRAVASMIDVNLLAGGLVDGANIVRWLADTGVCNNIENLSIPYAAVATDVSTGREIWLQEGPLEKAIRASIAMPGVFSPFEMDGRWLVDGGLVNPVPVSLCRALGAEFIIAVSLNEDLLGRRLVRDGSATAEDTAVAESGGNLMDMLRNVPKSVKAMSSSFRLFGNNSPTPGYFDVLANAINIMQVQITRARLAGEPPHVEITPHVASVGLMDFHRAGEAINEGRAATERALPLIESRLRVS